MPLLLSASQHGTRAWALKTGCPSVHLSVCLSGSRHGRLPQVRPSARYRRLWASASNQRTVPESFGRLTALLTRAYSGLDGVAGVLRRVFASTANICLSPPEISVNGQRHRVVAVFSALLCPFPPLSLSLRRVPDRQSSPGCFKSVT